MFLAYIHTYQLPLPLTYFWHSRAVRKLFTPLGTNMFFTLTNHPNLRGRDHKYTYVIVKQRGVSRIRESFFSVTEWLICGTVYQFVQICKSQ